MNRNCKTIDQIAEIYLEESNDGTTSDEKFDSAVPLLSRQDLKRNSLSVGPEKFRDCVPESIAFTNKGRALPSGSILFAKDLSNYHKSRAVESVHILNRPAAIDNSVVALVPKNGIEPRYLYYWLLHFDLRRLAKLRNLTREISFSKLASAELAIPYVCNQNHIIETLDRVTRQIEFHNRLDCEMENMMLSKFVETFGNLVTNSQALPLTKLHTVFKAVPPHFEKCFEKNSTAGSDSGLLICKASTKRMDRHQRYKSRQLKYEVKKNDLSISTNSSSSKFSQLIPENCNDFAADVRECVLRTRQVYGYGFLYGLSHFQWFQNLVFTRARWPKYEWGASANLLDLEVPYPGSESLHRDYDLWVSKVESIRELRKCSGTKLEKLMHTLLDQFYRH